uniref:Uncharacterized protein n=1 Tax=Coptis chinensis TaxID=261450 RepID=A0A835I8E8_9MAGN|nr:hypothetical protein IFM89_036666 [Coptis chinensis]
MDREATRESPLREIRSTRNRFPGAVRLKAYRFDGLGNFDNKEWDLSEGTGKEGIGKEFCWYHVEIPRGFSPTGQSLLSEVPSVESPSVAGGQENDENSIVIMEHVLEFFLTMNHSEEADNPVPKTVSNLVVHVLDTHVDHLQDIVTKLEMDLDSVELHMDKVCTTKDILDHHLSFVKHVSLFTLRGQVEVVLLLKKQMMDDRRFPKMHLNLQPPAAIQAGLDSWQAEQINRKLYYLSFLSIIFLPLSIVTGVKYPLLLTVFGMNVGGVPWTGQNNPLLKEGFRNVMLICVAMVLLVLLCFIFPALYVRLASWRKQMLLKRSWSLNRKSFFRRNVEGRTQERSGYLRI